MKAVALLLLLVQNVLATPAVLKFQVERETRVEKKKMQVVRDELLVELRGDALVTFDYATTETRYDFTRREISKRAGNDLVSLYSVPAFRRQELANRQHLGSILSAAAIKDTGEMGDPVLLEQLFGMHGDATKVHPRIATSHGLRLTHRGKELGELPATVRGQQKATVGSGVTANSD